MDKDFLQDYDAREFEEHRKYVEWIIEDRGGINPLQKRLIEPQEPFVRCNTFRGESIWAQIPFSGSLILKIPNVEEPDFNKLYGIKGKEIPELVNFIKNTGRLQITLGSSPSEYLGLDYLSPIFEELQPPYEKGFPNEAFITENLECRYGYEYITIGNINYFNFLENIFRQIEERGLIQTSSKKFVETLKRREISAYITLKLVGYTEIIEELQNLMVDDPIRAMNLFGICMSYITSPFTDPLCKARSQSLDQASEQYNAAMQFQSISEKRAPKIDLPFEIGKFLMTKLTYYPESLYACKELIAHYESTDLIKMISEFNRGINECNPDVINETRDELSQLMTEIWENKEIRRRIDGLRFGIPLSIGIVGAIAAGPIGGISGILAEIGLTVSEKLFDFKLKGLSEKIEKFFSTSYQAYVYDFKKKYNLK